jgi:NADP-dependent 3-hydroxy acid dehydrogenase YdfG
MPTLNDKIAWVTGAGSGIGEAAAEALGRAGATLVLTGRRPEPLERVAARIEAGGGKALALPTAPALALSRPRSGGGSGVSISWSTTRA